MKFVFPEANQRPLMAQNARWGAWASLAVYRPRKGENLMAGVTPVDAHVGVRLKARRRELGMSQTALAMALGCSFQQVQKYERGANRVSASALWIIAGALGVEVGFVFEGLQR